MGISVDKSTHSSRFTMLGFFDLDHLLVVASCRSATGSSGLASDGAQGILASITLSAANASDLSKTSAHSVC
jgi:hypothetical protein